MKVSGKVQVDDAYLGGERIGGKVGRGSEDKVAFVAAVSLTDEGHPLRVKLSFGFRKYAAQYLGTFAYQFNRRLDLKTLPQRLLVAATQCGSHSQGSIRMVAEVHPKLSIRRPFGSTRVLADDLRSFWFLLRRQ